MARQRITFVTNGDTRMAPGMAVFLGAVGKVTVESVEYLPEPTVQEFRVQVTSPSDLGPLSKSSVEVFLGNVTSPFREIIVTEVTS